MTEVGQVERQLLWNTDVELTDSNVVDYLLDVTPDDTVAADCSHLQHQHQHQHQHQPQPDSARTSDDRSLCGPQQVYILPSPSSFMCQLFNYLKISSDIDPCFLSVSP